MDMALHGIVLCAMSECNYFLTARYKKNLCENGFKTAKELADFCAENMECIFAMEILITAMLNGLHIHILTPKGNLHIHPHVPRDICHCVFCAALVQGAYGPEYLPLEELSTSDWEKQKKWVNCTIAKENTLWSVAMPEKCFKSALPAVNQNEPLDLSLGTKKASTQQEWNGS